MRGKPFQKVALIGVGLLGGSLGMALRSRGLAKRVEGFVRREAAIPECLDCAAVDHASCDLAAVVGGADLLVFCTPLAQMPVLAAAASRYLSQGAIATDVGSVKASVVREVGPLIAKAGGRFLGSHPMAGAEKTGVRAARSDLFENSVCVLTPDASDSAGDVKELGALWEAVGARVLVMSPALHDEFVARTSHLPHVLAAQLALYVLDSARPPEQRQLCANGFKDTTRIAAGSPEMWRDIVLANRDELLRSLEEYLSGLASFREALLKRDSKAIDQIFSEARERRAALPPKTAAPSSE